MKVNWTALAWFLGITFGVTYALEFAMVAAGLRFESGLTAQFGQYVVAGAMWIPALAAFVTAKVIIKEDTNRFGLRFGALKPYVVWWAAMPATFALIYAISWGLGLATPDFQMKGFFGLLAANGADMSSAPPPGLLILLLFGTSVLAGSVFNTLFALGEEIGWRGYLLPHLMPLGRPAAYAIGGVIWALWHLPLILAGFTYPGYPVLGLVVFILLVSAINVIENELYLRCGNSTLIAAWFHSLFNSQKLGIWTLIFVGINPLIGGYAGLVGIVIFGIAAIVVVRAYALRNRQVASKEEAAGKPEAALG